MRGSAWQIVLQTEHGELAGQFARAWAPRPEPFGSLEIVARRHDDGWFVWEQRPEPRPRRPAGELPRRAGAAAPRVLPRRDRGRHGRGRLCRADPVDARSGHLQVPLRVPVRPAHALRRRRRRRRPRASSPIRRTPTRSAWPRSASTRTRPGRGYKLLQVWDRLSLYSCLQDLAAPQPMRIEPTPYGGAEIPLDLVPLGPGRVGVEPYVFGDSPRRVPLRAPFRPQTRVGQRGGLPPRLLRRADRIGGADDGAGVSLANDTGEGPHGPSRPPDHERDRRARRRARRAVPRRAGHGDRSRQPAHRLDRGERRCRSRPRGAHDRRLRDAAAPRPDQHAQPPLPEPRQGHGRRDVPPPVGRDADPPDRRRDDARRVLPRRPARLPRGDPQRHHRAHGLHVRRARTSRCTARSCAPCATPASAASSGAPRATSIPTAAGATPGTCRSTRSSTRCARSRASSRAGCPVPSVLPAPGTMRTMTVGGLIRVKEYALAEGCQITIHMGEHTEERETSIDRWGIGAFHKGEEIGFLGPQVVAAHCVKLDRDELEIVARTGTQVSYNPVCNMYLGNGFAPVAATCSSWASTSASPATAAPAATPRTCSRCCKYGVLPAQGRGAGSARVQRPRRAARSRPWAAPRRSGSAADLGALEVGRLADMFLFDPLPAQDGADARPDLDAGLRRLAVERPHRDRRRQRGARRRAASRTSTRTRSCARCTSARSRWPSASARSGSCAVVASRRSTTTASARRRVRATARAGEAGAADPRPISADGFGGPPSGPPDTEPQRLV